MHTWQRIRYPINWEELATACKASAKWRCEKCSIAEGTWRIGGKRAYQVWLNAAHLDHDPWNPNPRLMALCQDCHFKHDALENGRKMKQSKCRKDFEGMLKAGQLMLFEDAP